MESETEYWRRNRETFLSKEGFQNVVTLSSILREEGARYEGLVEELVGVSIAYGWKPVYIRIMWFFRPIEGSCAQACDWERRRISEDDYQALLEYGAAALPQIWRIVCSCGASNESRWKDHQSLFMHWEYVEPSAEHTWTFEESPAADWTWTRITQM